MENPKDHLNHLSEIKSLMEESTRFLSLSGLSGVFAGIFALIGAAVAYMYLDLGLFSNDYYSQAYDSVIQGSHHSDLNRNFVLFFIIDAGLVLILALSVGSFFTTRRARKQGKKIFTSATKKLLINLAIPLTTGGLFCIILLSRGVVSIIAPTTLVFYGLALLNASKYTYSDIRYLGIAEIVLGLFGLIWVGYGLLIWAFGFGVLHIVYGLYIQRKYEKIA